MKSEYDIAEHKHRFAVWAAATAASSRSLPFKVVIGKRWIECVEELKKCSKGVDHLPPPHLFDECHARWRNQIIDEGKKTQKPTTDETYEIEHGVAAKLINVYLKAAVIDHSNFNDPRVNAVHPPIDRLLLAELKRRNPEIWKNQKLAWSKFSSDAYEDVIVKVRETLDEGVALWKIEEFWRGNQ